MAEVGFEPGSDTESSPKLKPTGEPQRSSYFTAEIMLNFSMVKGLRDSTSIFLSISWWISATFSTPRLTGHLLVEFSFKLRAKRKRGRGERERERVYDSMPDLF